MRCGKKEFLKYSVLQGSTCWGKLVSGCLWQVSYECMKEIYKVSTIASFIFFDGGTQAPILDTNYHKRSP